MKTQLLEYEDNSTTLEAYIARPETDKPKPTVLICHAWGGRDQFACDKAEEIAKIGYVGFALDMYGKDKLGNSIEENSALMTPLMEDRNKLKQRITAAYETAIALPFVDETNVAAIGFCFGGLCVLDLARSGTTLNGVVSFHGLLQPPEMKAESIHAKILALHGDDDPMVTPDAVREFQMEMTNAECDWQMHIYGNTQHAFTNPEANDTNLGTVYNEAAAKRSWQAMKNFLSEIF